MTKTKIIPALSILILATLACNALASPTSPTAEPIATTIIEELSTPSAGNNIPLTEADVPRVSLEDARVAIESGDAIAVDVRSVDAYSAGHIPGAISLPLNEIEINPIEVGLDKDQWIITYCT